MEEGFIALPSYDTNAQKKGRCEVSNQEHKELEVQLDFPLQEMMEVDNSNSHERHHQHTSMLYS
jgi:hypothetical protein